MREVTRYQTQDGKLFESEQQAELHEHDLLCNAVDVFLRNYCTDAHARSTYQAVTKIMEDKDNAAANLRHILELIEE